MTALPSRWLEEVRSRGVAQVAAALGGFTVAGRGLSPCPACHEEKRHPKRRDKRGAVGLTSDALGWRCFECAGGGDAVSFAAWTLLGRSMKGITGDDIGALRRACAERGLCEHNPRDRMAAPPARRLPLPPPAPFVTARRPPPDELAALWAACVPLGLDADLSAAWAKRGIEVGHVEDRDLARVLPKGVDVPRWAWGPSGKWSARHHRLLVPMFDAEGRLASLHARAFKAPPDALKGWSKGLSPAGYAVAGLVMADPLGRLLLAGERCADGEPAAEVVRRCGLVICEGVPDWLTWATRWGDTAEDAPAVLGMISGSWTGAMAERVPDGARVAVRQHADRSGEKYTAAVVATLAGRCRVEVLVGGEG